MGIKTINQLDLVYGTMVRLSPDLDRGKVSSIQGMLCGGMPQDRYRNYTFKMKASQLHIKNWRKQRHKGVAHVVAVLDTEKITHIKEGDKWVKVKIIQ